MGPSSFARQILFLSILSLIKVHSMSALSHIQRNILILRSLLEFEDTFKGSNYNVSNDERVQWDISYLVWKNYYQKKQGKSYLMHMNFFKKKIRRTQWQSNVQKLLSQIHFFLKKKFKNNSPTTHLLISEVQFLTRLILQEALSQYIQDMIKDIIKFKVSNIRRKHITCNSCKPT